jgi:hypothetical protein
MKKGEIQAISLFLTGFIGAAIASLLYQAILAAPVLVIFLAGFTALTFFAK